MIVCVGLLGVAAGGFAGPKVRTGVIWETPPGMPKFSCQTRISTPGSMLIAPETSIVAVPKARFGSGLPTGSGTSRPRCHENSRSRHKS